MNLKKMLVTLIIAVAGANGLAETRQVKALETVPAIDLTRYAGQWYEVARLPNRFQQNCAGEVTATYSLLAENRIRVVNACRRENGQKMSAEGKARLAEASGTTAKLKVRFVPAWLSWLPMVWADYWILDLAADYSYAVVGTPDRQYLWILSRTPQMDETIYRRLLQQIADKGFATAKLVKTRQGV